MYKLLFLILSFFLFIGIGYAQNDVLLKGKINNQTLGEISVNIINITQQTGTINTENGGFEIAVAENDTLLFSSIPYKRLEIKIDKEIIGSGYLEVTLQDNVNELDAVNINNYRLSGNLSQDTKDIKTITAFSVGLPVSKKPPLTQAERRIYSATHSSSGLPVDYLINLISGRLKELKKIKENQDLSILVNKTIETFPSEFFAEHLKISEDLIYRFIYYAAEERNLKYVVETGNELDLIQYFEKIAEDFLQLQK
ncbi:hypothetical protein [Gillisia sp. Hel_I_29]|uniref:hypothetical protein n=1 Tax=Gillisia sp. Hel_I_29 TaxID=1249975 RepID=UPI0005581DEC|nr:hypothetical protein [Gillisia sp. Hel_I_29]